MQQVFRNVLENARDANEKKLQISSEKSTGKQEIAVSISESENDIQISISDTGGGIQTKDKAEIFEPFFTTKTRGTGLGLAISKRIIDAHSGTIDVEDCHNGSTFHIRLPISN